MNTITSFQTDQFTKDNLNMEEGGGKEFSIGLKEVYTAGTG